LGDFCYWLIELVSDSDWMIDWLIDWLVDWLIDWLIDLLFFASLESTKFCKDWANTMLKGDISDPIFLREVVENYKLRVSSLESSENIVLHICHLWIVEVF